MTLVRLLIPSRDITVTFEIQAETTGPVGTLRIGDEPLLVNYSRVDIKPDPYTYKIQGYERAGFEVLTFPCFGIAYDIGDTRELVLAPKLKATGPARLYASIDRATHSEWFLEVGHSVHGSVGGNSISSRRKCELVIDVDAKIGWYFEEHEEDNS